MITEFLKYWMKNKHDLIELRKEKLKGHCIRARAKWDEEGEKPTKYFCNMESRNYYSKLISRIELNNGTVITDQKDILKETKCFFIKTYTLRQWYIQILI